MESITIFCQKIPLLPRTKVKNPSKGLAISGLNGVDCYMIRDNFIANWPFDRGQY